MAVSSGAGSLEAAALVSKANKPADSDLAAVRDLGSDAVILLAGPDGAVREIIQP